MSTRALLLRRHSVLPGFNLALGFALLYLCFIVLIPLSAVFLKTFTVSWGTFVDTVTSPRVVASYKLTFGASFLAALVNAVFGLLVSWVLVRYRFPGKRLVDALVDLPFALPTAVAGIALTTLYASNGWIGKWLPFKVSYTPLGVFVALTFIGLPFVVRTVQPVLEDLQRELEEAAATLGATRLQTFALRDLPRAGAGAADRLRAGVRARAGRVRLGDLHRRQHADGLGDHVAADHHEAGAVRLRRRHVDRRRDAGRRVRCCCC
jgi:sulfate ABC transporter permease subunit